MGDQHQRASPRHPVDGLEDLGLRARIDGAHGIVEHEHGWGVEQRPRQRHALLLPARELHAALAHQGVEAVGQAVHLLEDGRLLCGGAHALPGSLAVGFVEGEGDVAVDRGREQEGILRRVGDLPSQAAKAQLIHVDAIHEDRIVRHRQEPRHQGGQRALARADASHDGQGGSRRHLDVDVREHVAVTVGEAQASQGERALPAAFAGVGELHDALLGVEDLTHARVGGATALHDAEQEAEGHGRPEKLTQVGQERRELTHAELVREHHLAPEPDHHERARRAQQHQHGPHGAADDGQLHVGHDGLLVGLLEAALLVLLEPEAAHHAHGGHVLLGALCQVSKRLLCALTAQIEALGEGARHQREEGIGHEGVERELRAEREHQRECADVGHQGVHAVHQPESREQPDLCQVVGRPAHDLARRHLLREAGSEAVHLGQQLLAQVVLDVAADVQQDDARERAHEPHDGGQRQHDQRCVHHRLALPMAQGVDGVGQEPGDGLVRRIGGEQEADASHGRAPVGREIVEDPRARSAGLLGCQRAGAPARRLRR